MFLFPTEMPSMPSSSSQNANGTNQSGGGGGGMVQQQSSTIPTIKHIFPSDGWCQGGGTAILIGENFHDGLQVLFGNTVAWSEVSPYM
jgi:early B-cell factor